MRNVRSLNQSSLMWQGLPSRSDAKVPVRGRSPLGLILGTTGIVGAAAASLSGLVFGMSILLRTNDPSHGGLQAADPFTLTTHDLALKTPKLMSSAEMAAALRREAGIADKLVATYRRELAETALKAAVAEAAPVMPPMPPEKPDVAKPATVAMTDPVAFPFPLPSPRPFFQAPRAPQVAEAKPAAPAAPFDKVAPETADDAKSAAPPAQLAYAPAAAPTGDTGGGFFGGLFSSRTTPSAPAPSAAGTIRGDRVAVYDISAGIVYMPNGEKLEAHSGVGPMRDNPRYSNVRMRGPTPPATYALTLREAPFHGVDAIRLTPISGTTFGRDGFLAHTYMLRSRGDSNGCVVFADYDRFLRAFKRNEVKQLVVVPKLGQRMS